MAYYFCRKVYFRINRPFILFRSRMNSQSVFIIVFLYYESNCTYIFQKPDSHKWMYHSLQRLNLLPQYSVCTSWSLGTLRVSIWVPCWGRMSTDWTKPFVFCSCMLFLISVSWDVVTSQNTKKGARKRK